MKRDYAVVVAIIALVVIAGWLLLPVQQPGHIHRVIHAKTMLRGLAQGMATYAGNHGDVYPDGYGVLIFEGYIAPEHLRTTHDPRESVRLSELDEYEWEYEDVDRIPEMDEIASEYSSFIVLGWGAAADFDRETVLAYERLSTLRKTTLVAYGDIRVEEVARDRAIRQIQDSGHEPVWAD